MRGVFHTAVRCIASVFMGSPYCRGAVDAAVLAESGRPVSEGRLGIVHGMQELAPNPYRPLFRRSFLTSRLIYFPLRMLESILWSIICSTSPAVACVSVLAGKVDLFFFEGRILG
jgi:hypothetical protein